MTVSPVASDVVPWNTWHTMACCVTHHMVCCVTQHTVCCVTHRIVCCVTHRTVCYVRHRTVCCVTHCTVCCVTHCTMKHFHCSDIPNLRNHRDCLKQNRGLQAFCQRTTQAFTTVRGPDILRNVIVSDMLHSTISTNVSKIDYFFNIDKMSSLAGFGPRAVVWRPVV